MLDKLQHSAHSQLASVALVARLQKGSHALCHNIHPLHLACAKLVKHAKPELAQSTGMQPPSLCPGLTYTHTRSELLGSFFREVRLSPAQDHTRPAAFADLSGSLLKSLRLLFATTARSGHYSRPSGSLSPH